MRRAILAIVVAVVGLAHPDGSGAQALRAGPGVDWRDVVAAEVGARLSVAPATLRVEAVGDLASPVDSLEVILAGSSRWMVTAWGNGAPQRRFLHVERVAEVPVAARPIARGSVLGPDDVRLEERRLPWSPASASSRDAVGMAATRPLVEGEPLLAPAVRPPILVRGGDAIEAVLQRSGLLMTLRAEALGSAREGEPVHVRLPSGTRAKATVVGAGRVLLSEGGRR